MCLNKNKKYGNRRQAAGGSETVLSKDTETRAAIWGMQGMPVHT